MRRFFSVFLASILMTSAVNAAIYVDDDKLSINYVIEESRVLIPVRGVFEKLGYTVNYDVETKLVTLDTSDNHIEIKTNDDGLLANGKWVEVDVPQRIISNRLFLPLRAIVELTPGYTVSWDATDKNIFIKHISAVEQNINSDDTTSMTKEVFTLINNYREQNGLSALEWSDELAAVAQAHSKDMADNGFFSHTNLNNETPFDRIEKAGIKYVDAGENIAAGEKTAQAVYEAWINSEGHRENILNPNYHKVGVGCYKSADSDYYIYWTQTFTN